MKTYLLNLNKLSPETQFYLERKAQANNQSLESFIMDEAAKNMSNPTHAEFDKCLSAYLLGLETT